MESDVCGLHIVRSDLYHDGKPFFRTQRKPRFPRGREGTVLNERPHVDYFDGLRIFAALCVIFMHTAAGPLRAGVNTDWHLLNVCTSLAFTAVPLFFMMSGYLLMTSRKTADISVLLRHRLPRLVVPLAGWTVVAVLWQMFLAHTLTPGAIWAQLVTALHGPVMVHFWYLYTLIALYALSPILYGGIQVLGKSGRVYLFVLAAAVSAHTILMTVLPDGAAQYVDLDIFDKLKIFGGHMATFVLGYLLGSYEKEIPNWLLALGAVVLLAVISVGTWVRTVRTGEFNQSFQNQSAGFEIVLASCIFLLCKQTCNRPPRAWVKAVTGPVVALSMAIYLMHNIFLSMLFSVGVSVHSFGSTVGVTLLAFAACFVVTKTVATIRPLCYLATGKTYAEACRSCNWVYTFRRLRGHSAAEK